MPTSYGTGTALQFSDATQRQVLELGSKIHYYNPNATPIFSMFGMKSVVTPVPIFEWMEDEYFFRCCGYSIWWRKWSSHNSNS